MRWLETAVDIAPVEETGANESHQPISFSEADLLPDPGA